MLIPSQVATRGLISSNLPIGIVSDGLIHFISEPPSGGSSGGGGGWAGHKIVIQDRTDDDIQEILAMVLSSGILN